MYINRCLWLLWILCISSTIKASPPEIERIPFSVPLLKLSLMHDNTSVRVSRQNDDDYAIISLIDDQFIKNNRDNVVKTVFKEYKHQAHFMSDFEAKYLLLASRSFEQTLDEFEHQLQQEQWGQCAYLDGFLPRFIYNYYYLLAIVRNTNDKYTHQTKLFQNSFEVSLSSPLTDNRIAEWQSDDDRLMKLRIATKELAHQLRIWEKRELSNKNRNPEVSLNTKVEEALDLFVRIYFCIKTPQPRYLGKSSRK